MIKRIDSIPKGAVKIHIYHFKNVLKPRGSMQKESLGLGIYERLTAIFEDWTDPGYGDNPETSYLMIQLRENLMTEVEAAWMKFMNERK